MDIQVLSQEFGDWCVPSGDFCQCVATFCHTYLLNPYDSVVLDLMLAGF